MNDSCERRGHLICFEGIDGSGKSTIAQKINRALMESGIPVTLFSRENNLEPVNYGVSRLNQITEMLWRYPTGLRIQDLGDRHLIHLMVSWFHLFDSTALQPALKQRQVVLVDGWFYKYVARFALKPAFKGTDVERWFEAVTAPDLICMLEVPPELAWRRKMDAKATESDTAESCLNHARQRFIAYQTDVQGLLVAYAMRRNWLKLDSSDCDSLIATICSRLCGIWGHSSGSIPESEGGEVRSLLHRAIEAGIERRPL